VAEFTVCAYCKVMGCAAEYEGRRSCVAFEPAELGMRVWRLFALMNGVHPWRLWRFSFGRWAPRRAVAGRGWVWGRACGPGVVLRTARGSPRINLVGFWHRRIVDRDRVEV
jgi:hypothetical protein